MREKSLYRFSHLSFFLWTQFVKHIKFWANRPFLLIYFSQQITHNTRSVRKVSGHFEYLENRSRGIDVTWQPVRGDFTAHP